MQRKFSLAGNDWPSTMAWAAAHEVDRLWSVSVTDVHVMPNLRTMLYRTLDDALKAAFDLSFADRAWFRREADTEHDEPFITLRVGKPTCPIVAFLSPVMLDFTMPAVRTTVADEVLRRERAAQQAHDEQVVNEIEERAVEYILSRSREAEHQDRVIANESNDYV